MAKPGDILRGRYRLDAIIGRGGMGQVFAARDYETGHDVAVKSMSRLLVDETMMARLQREAEAASRIQSDFVPRVLEVGSDDDGETFLVMERLMGESLSERIRENGALSWSEVGRVGEDVLRGLIDAHTAGIVHRDLKPSNVFLALKDGRIRAMVLDFGVCKMDSPERGYVERLTGTGESIGTVAYMAPEQIRGAAKVDDRADLYGFGVMVFEMLTGRLPHEGPSQMAILASKLENPPARLDDHTRVPIPDGVEDLVARALSREPAQRFASAQELLKAWRGLTTSTRVVTPSSVPLIPRGDDQSTTLRDDDRSFVPSEPHPTQTALTAGTSLRVRSGSTRIALVLAACGLLAGVVVVAISFSRTNEAERPAAAARAAGADTTPATSVSTSTFEVPPDPAPSPSHADDAGAPRASAESKRPPPATVTRQPAAKPTGKASGPHITTQPRY